MPQSESTTGYCLSMVCRVLSQAAGSFCRILCFRSDGDNLQQSPFVWQTCRPRSNPPEDVVHQMRKPDADLDIVCLHYPNI